MVLLVCWGRRSKKVVLLAEHTNKPNPLKKPQLNGWAIQALPPPPNPELNGSRNFLFYFLKQLCLKIAENGFCQFLKRAIFFAKYCNKPGKRLRLCQQCQYLYFVMSSLVIYLYFQIATIYFFSLMAWPSPPASLTSRQSQHSALDPFSRTSTLKEVNLNKNVRLSNKISNFLMF